MKIGKGFSTEVPRFSFCSKAKDPIRVVGNPIPEMQGAEIGACESREGRRGNGMCDKSAKYSNFNFIPKFHCHEHLVKARTTRLICRLTLFEILVPKCASALFIRCKMVSCTRWFKVPSLICFHPSYYFMVCA